MARRGDRELIYRAQRAGIFARLRDADRLNELDTVTWDRLAEIAGRYLGKGQQVAIEGRLQTRSWDDERGAGWSTSHVLAPTVGELHTGHRRLAHAIDGWFRGPAAGRQV